VPELVAAGFAILASYATRARAENSFITFGVPARRSLTAAVMSVVIPSQFLFMVSLFNSGD